MLTIVDSGSFKKLQSFLNSASKADIMSVLRSYGQEGVNALAAMTPSESGLTAHSWGYEVDQRAGAYYISWTNTDIENGFPVAIMLQYGYGTGTGGYIQGRDYINPAIRPVFDKIADKAWKAVTSA